MVIFLSTSYTKAQSWEYSQHIATTHGAEIRGLTLDSDTNLYITAFHKDSADLIGPHGEKRYYSAGNQDILVLKLSPSGDTLWTRQIQGTNSDYPRQIELDNEDNPYITGVYRRSPLTIQETILPTYDEYDVFLAKYTSDGEAAMTPKRIAWGPDNDNVLSMAIDGKNNIYMSGEFESEVYFDSDTLISSTSINRSLFLAKFNSLGDLIWAKEIPTTNTSTSFLDIDISQNNEIYLSGFFTDTLIFDEDTVISTGSILGNTEDIILVKMDSTGALQWIRTAGSSVQNDRANGLTTDESGAVYITGLFSGTAEFESETIASAGLTDMFLAKYNPSGDLIWVKRHGSSGNDVAYGAKVRDNILITTGAFSGTVSFSNTIISTHNKNEQNPGFFVYNIDGEPITASSLPTNISNTNNRAEYIEYDQVGNVYIGGYFRADSLFVGNDTLIRQASSGSDPRDAFIGKYSNPFTAILSENATVNCPDDSTGELEVITYFGTQPYTYEWSHDAGLDTAIATNLPSGIYSVKVTDALGDTALLTDTISAPDTIKTSLIQTDISCYDANDGAISTTVSGGLEPYEYSWTGPSGIDPSEQDQSDLDSGWCYLTVTDQNGCQVTDSALISEPDEITFGPVSITPESPANSYTGKIILNVSGGTPDYTYTWDSAGTIIGTNADSLVNRTEGYYNVTVQDFNGCLNDTTILITGESLRIQAIGTDISCYGVNDGQAVVSFVSGSDNPPFNIIWTDSIGTDITEDDSTTITNLSPGWYYVTVTDAVDSVSSDSVQIIEPDSITTTLSYNSLDCYGDNNGYVSLSVSGGEAPYTYLWSNDKTTESISNLSAGEYVVNVTDNNGCIVNDTAIIEQNDSLIVNIVVSSPISCNNESDGILTANVSGGVTDYSYLWDDPGSQTTSYAQNLDEGTYSVTVVDAVGCTEDAEYSIVNPELITISDISITPVSCYDGDNGVAEISITGGTSPYSYSWTDNTLIDTNKRSDLDPGDYTVTVSDVNGCELDSTLAFTIEQPSNALTVTEDTDSHIDNTCYGGSLGSLSVTASGGWGQYSYATDTNNWSSTNSFSELSAADYLVYVKDSNNCVESIEVEITEPTELLVSSSVVSNSIAISASGGTSPYAYQLNSETSSQESGQFEDLEDGTYWVLVTDANSCGPVSSDTIEIDLTALSDYLLAETKVYPNPSDGEFKVDLKPTDDGEFVIEIYSTNGSLVKKEIQFAESEQTTTISFDLSNSPTGVYMLKINGIVLPSKLIVK